MALYRLAQAAAKLAHGCGTRSRPRPSHWILARSRAAARQPCCRQTRGGPGPRQRPATSQNLVVQLACSSLGVASASARAVVGVAIATTYAIDATHCRPRIPRRWHGQKRPRSRSSLHIDVGGILCTDAPNDGHMARRVADPTRGGPAPGSRGREGETVSGGANENHTTSDPIERRDRQTAEDTMRHLELTPSDTACVIHHALARWRDWPAAACVSRVARASRCRTSRARGCGVPSDRAAATLLALEDGATVSTRTAHFEALPSDVNLPQLRTGV